MVVVVVVAVAMVVALAAHFLKNNTVAKFNLGKNSMLIEKKTTATATAVLLHHGKGYATFSCKHIQYIHTNS